jgi:hypothetical protein
MLWTRFHLFCRCMVLLTATYSGHGFAFPRGDFLVGNLGIYNTLYEVFSKIIPDLYNGDPDAAGYPTYTECKQKIMLFATNNGNLQGLINMRTGRSA